MSRVALAAVINFLGLAMAAWGISMLLGTHSLFGIAVEAGITSGGLGLVFLSTMLLFGLSIFRNTREDRSRETFADPALSMTPVPLRHQDQLVNAMQDLRDSALDLIERRREIHHLNTHQWTYAHRDETTGEIAANKRYRQAKSALELHRLSLPTEFWAPVDGFCDAIEVTMARETYSPPKDRQVYDNFARIWHTTMREINDIVSGRPAVDGRVEAKVRQMAD